MCVCVHVFTQALHVSVSFFPLLYFSYTVYMKICKIVSFSMHFYERALNNKRCRILGEIRYYSSVASLCIYAEGGATGIR